MFVLLLLQPMVLLPLTPFEWCHLLPSAAEVLKPSGETEGPYFNRFRQHTPVGLQKLTGFAGPNKLDI